MLTLLTALLQQVPTGSAVMPSPRTWNISENLRIDGEKADLVSATFLRVAANGVIAVGQPQDVAVRFFSSEGADLGRYGQRGEGPSEFIRLPSFAGYHENRLWLVDPQSNKATLLTPEGKLLQTVAPEGSKWSRAGKPIDGPRNPALQMFTSSGELVYSLFFALSQPTIWKEMVGQGDRLFFRTSRTNEVRGIVAIIAGNLFCIESSGVVLPTSLCEDTRVAFSSDGRRIVTLESSSIRPAQPGAYRVTSITVEGDTTFSRVFPGERVGIPDQVIDSVRADGIKRMPAQQEAWKAAKLPKYYPAATRAIAGRDGSTWIRLRPTSRGRPWIILDEKGAVIGNLIVPLNVDIGAADRTNIWATVTDDDGLPSIVRYRIVK